MGHLDTKKYDFSHHDHRLSKCKFSNYFKTIKYLISQGYKVIRIGKNSKTIIDIILLTNMSHLNEKIKLLLCAPRILDKLHDLQ